ncbi:MAG: hypothetical protein NDI61_06360 [Bdellovibrionaceae bacterium]|nr:hypothetical protein [Pseudobdellovibrionaceae bacterium]
MDALKQQTPEDTTRLTRQERYLREHASCPMCETDLKMNHDIDKNQNKVKEIAHCPECDLCARTTDHLLH